jgi:hypothetical protein
MGLGCGSAQEFWNSSLRVIHNGIEGRSRRLRELSIAQAFDAARIRQDLETGKAKSLTDYLAALRPAGLRTESPGRFFNWLDRQADRARKGS